MGVLETASQYYCPPDEEIDRYVRAVEATYDLGVLAGRRALVKQLIPYIILSKMPVAMLEEIAAYLSD